MMGEGEEGGIERRESGGLETENGNRAETTEHTAYICVGRWARSQWARQMGLVEVLHRWSPSEAAQHIGLDQVKRNGPKTTFLHLGSFLSIKGVIGHHHRPISWFISCTQKTPKLVQFIKHRRMITKIKNLQI